MTWSQERDEERAMTEQQKAIIEKRRDLLEGQEMVTRGINRLKEGMKGLEKAQIKFGGTIEKVVTDMAMGLNMICDGNDIVAKKSLEVRKEDQ